MKKLAPALFLLVACGVEPIRHTGFVIGTTFSLTFYGQDRPDLWEAILEDFEWLDNTMTIWDRPQPSELMLANDQAGSPEGVTISPELAEVIRIGLHYGELSNGALDITIGPLVKAWGVATDNPRVPEASEIQEALNRTGLSHVRLEDSKLYLSKPGMILDLGAVAKGWMADRVASRLKANGVARAIVDLGGNILLLGYKPDNSLWKVGIQDPWEIHGRYLGILEAGPTSVVTSGIYERYFEHEGVRYHHIMDNKTGYPVDNELAGVTIVHPNSATADALSTAVFVLGLEKGRSLAESQGAETIFITKDRRVIVSSGLRSSFTLTNDEYQITE